LKSKGYTQLYTHSEAHSYTHIVKYTVIHI
jgi:hypothetical protein